MPQKILRLILGDQLNSNHSWFKNLNPSVTYVLMELMQEQTYVKHHIQKILAFFGAMRQFATELKSAGHNVVYIPLDDIYNTQGLEQNIKGLVGKYKITRFEYQLPDEYRLDEQLKEICLSLNIPSSYSTTEHFLFPRDGVKIFFQGKKQYLMENFYRHVREKFHILMEGEEPLSGRWNYDAENRKKYDYKVALVAPRLYDHDLSAIKLMLDKHHVPYFGKAVEHHVVFPLSRIEALSLLDYFCNELLPYFGTYEDAMLNDNQTLFHSRLSFALNTKMLSPLEVIKKAIKTWQKSNGAISYAQIEGFVRQIIGWREFLRGIYWDQMPGYKKLNFFNHKQDLPHWYWDGDTKMNCLRQSLGNSLQNAYAHHIQRLMVIGNFSLLLGCDPMQTDTWYLGVYADAVEGVQLPNTHGMSQFADGGIIATKPYAASANYIDKMSDYCKVCVYDKKKRYGENACPFNSLYWDFFYRNQEKLQGNKRLSFVYKLLDKMKNSELQLITEQAAFIKAHVNNL